MFETLVNMDWGLFRAINSLNNPVLDSIMWWSTDRFIWIPWYAFLAYFLYRKFGRAGLVMIAFAALLILISDQTSVMIKDLVQRERPCHNLSLSFDVHLVNNRCGGKYGFVSSHAANTMALALYIILLTHGKFRWLNRSLLAFVVLVSYSRIYLGNHYPADIAGGWIIGAFAACITYFFYRAVVTEKIDINPAEE